MAALPDQLSALQNAVKRDPESYLEDYRLQTRAFDAELALLRLRLASDSSAFRALALFIAHAKATVAARESYKAWRSWNGGRTKAEFYKEDQKRKYQYLEDEQERLKTRQALHLSLGPAYQEYAKRLEAEAEAFEQQLQADLEQTNE